MLEHKLVGLWAAGCARARVCQHTTASEPRGQSPSQVAGGWQSQAGTSTQRAGQYKRCAYVRILPQVRKSALQTRNTLAEQTGVLH
eukprot:9973266-Alexandrium_andersonii.AAC.1